MTATSGAVEARRALARFVRAVVALAVFLLALAIPGATGGCRGGGLDTARIGAVATARVANAGGEAALSSMCVAECRAIGHTCHRAGAQCIRDSAPRAASVAELAELARVRAQWAPVLAAHERVRVAHDFVASLIGANDAKSLPAALASLAGAYAALVDTARVAGAELPSLPVGAFGSDSGADAATNGHGREADAAGDSE